jgi:hypothetical protein
LNAACGNVSFSQENIYAACELSSKHDFWKYIRATLFRKEFSNEEFDFLLS